MSKKVLDTTYTFNAATRTVTIPRYIPLEKVLLITNVTRGIVIYNFSSTTTNSSAWSYDPSTDTTTIVLDYNTASHSNTDKLQVIIDEYEEKFIPAETLMDPVSKLRVSQPTSLIDTDFEYGTQPTKWETVSAFQNRPTTFYDVGTPLLVTNMSASGRTVTVTVSSGAPAVGTPVYIQDSLDSNANGWYLVDTSNGSTSFTYIAKATTTVAAPLDATKTYIFTGNFYSNSFLRVGTGSGAAFTASGTTVTGTTTYAHGLCAGDGIYVIGTTAASANPPNGAWVVVSTPTATTFTFEVVNAPSGAITASAGATATLFPRSLGNSLHRSFDGGVNFTTGTNSPGYQLIRQTRRYFRYQSGKGIQFSTGTILKPRFDVDNITSSGTTVTVTTKFPHSLGVGAFVKVSGCSQTAYNGTYAVATVPTDRTFTYTALSTPSSSPATGFPNIYVGPESWYGSTNRIGMFDQQNGFFFEFDGQALHAVRRSSTQQLAGTIAVTNGQNIVTGTGTKFSQELQPGDFIVIRGMSYRINYIASDTSLSILPEYRGATISGNCIVTKTIDTRIPQSQWNIDKLDGTGRSGYNIDLSKIQMFYVDYSWYGAGAIRFGVKDQRGEVIYCHRFTHANVMTEAYMRSGNLPARYESNTLSPYTTLSAALASGSTTSMSVADTSRFPSAGRVILTAPGEAGVIEYIDYTGKSGNTLTGLTRNRPGGTGSATTFTPTSTAPIGVMLYEPEFAPTMAHWGSSVIMDGGYDDDKSFVFTAGMNSQIAVSSGATSALASLRLAPSVDSGLVGILGARDIINRMQLTLRQMDILSSGTFLVSLILNGRVSGGTFTNVGGSSLSQICFHNAGTTITGGEAIYSFYTNVSGGSTTFTTTQQELQLVRDLGNAVYGGGLTNTAPTTVANVYPDGPDIVTIVARNVSASSANIFARISWTEAQA
jgi:hypothetical protein